MYKDKTIPHKIAVKEVQQVKPVQVVSSKEFVERRVNIPSLDHPWRQVFYPSQQEIQAPVTA